MPTKEVFHVKHYEYWFTDIRPNDLGRLLRGMDHRGWEFTTMAQLPGKYAFRCVFKREVEEGKPELTLAEQLEMIKEIFSEPARTHLQG